MPFIGSRKFPSIPAFFSAFFLTTEGCCVLSSSFCVSWDDHVLGASLCWSGAFHWLIFTLSRICRNPAWSWVWCFHVCCWVRPASVSLAISASVSVGDAGCRPLFLWCLCPLLASGWWLASQNELGSSPFSSIFGRFCEELALTLIIL